MIKSISRKFYGYVKKDVLLLVRRKKHLYLFLALPFVIGLLFLFFLSPSPNNLETVACDNDGTSFSRDAVSNLNGFEVDFLDSDNCVEEMISLIKKRKYSLGLEIPNGFSDNLDNLKQSRILIYYDNTDIALANLVSWKVDSSLEPFERAIINKLNGEVKTKISSIRSGVDIVSDFSKSSSSINNRVVAIDLELKSIEEIDTEFLLNPIWIDSKPLYENQGDAGIAFVFPIIALFVVLMLSSTSLIYDRKSNFLVRVKSSTTPLLYLLAKLVFFFAITFVNFLIIFLLFIIYGSSFAFNPLQIINLIAFIAVTNTLVGLFIGSISDNEGVAVLFSLIISLPFMLVSGIFYPIQILPKFVQILSRMMPMNYQIAHSKTVLLLGQSIGSKWIYGNLILLVIVYYMIRRRH